MATPLTGPDPDDGFDTEPADVVDLDAVRDRRPASTPPLDDDQDDEADGHDHPDDDTPTQDTADEADEEDADEEDGTDRETVLIEDTVTGRPVDPPDEAAPTRRVQRKPIIPAALASRAAVRGTAVWWAEQARYWAAFHAVRTPKYAAKVAVFAPVGAARGTGRLVRWANAEEGNAALRQAAATRNDPGTWLALDARRMRQSRWRWLVATAVFVGVLLAVVLLVFAPLPVLLLLVAVTAALVALARLGRPEDKPITDRVSEAATYRKLTAELVRRALLSVQLAGINSAVAKDPRAISFPVEIHRDGPGHLAIVDLPYGVEAADVVARRGRLASGLRLPMDQVWPEPAPGHTGRLALWVGHEPASQMRQPAWPLIKAGSVDVFKPFPFATTPRLGIVSAELMYRNWLFGGQPGSGKTFALRDLVVAAALDPRVELRGYNLKGSGDFHVVEEVCTEYGNGFDDETIGRCAALGTWLYEECRRRAKRVDHYARLGKAPENKVTPELASLPGSGLHPLVVFVDEVQELFLHKTFGKDAGEVFEKVIKLGRALGVTLLLGTQIPDKDSLPTGITRNVNTRFCLSVADQTANDMILGTSAYKRGYRATVFKPVVEAGWGFLVGLGEPGALRSFYVDNDDAAKVMARAIAARGGKTTDEQERTRETAAYDVLDDVATVAPASGGKVWSTDVIERLNEYRPDGPYSSWGPEQLAAALAPHGVDTVQIGRGVDGKTVNRRGIDPARITVAIAERNRRRGSN